jgi:hypothetical protein
LDGKNERTDRKNDVREKEPLGQHNRCKVLKLM